MSSTSATPWASRPSWNLVGRLPFNLAENRKDENAPFALLATYTTRLSATAKAQQKARGGDRSPPLIQSIIRILDRRLGAVIFIFLCDLTTHKFVIEREGLEWLG
jgi:hypothetical protein